MGTTAPTSTAIAGVSPPLSPQIGQVWQNTSGGTVNGIPAGNFAYWNGSTWVSLGATAPQLGSTGGGSGAGVSSINNLQGAVTLAEGSGVDIIQAGNTITITATGVGTGTPGVSSVNGSTGAIQIAGANGNQVSANNGTVTIAAPPPGTAGVASFNARTGAVVPVATDYPPGFIGAATPAQVDLAIANHLGAVDPHAQYLLSTEAYGTDYIAANAAPTNPQSGQIWRNTSSGTVNGIPAGNFGVRTPTGVWFDAGPRYPFAINAGSTQVGSLQPGAPNTLLQTNASGQVGWIPLQAAAIPQQARNPGFTIINNSQAFYPSNVFSPVNPGTALIDILGGYNAANGTYTVPTGFGGLWQITCSWTTDILTYDAGTLYAYTSKSPITPALDNVLGTGVQMTVGIRSILLQPGDALQWGVYPLTTVSTAPARLLSTVTTGALIFPV